jgi:hypothetical protein
MFYASTRVNADTVTHYPTHYLEQRSGKWNVSLECTARNAPTPAPTTVSRQAARAPLSLRALIYAGPQICVYHCIKCHCTFKTAALFCNYRLFSFYSSLTEHRDRVVNAPVSYSGGPGFKSRPEGRLFWLTFFVVFLSPSRQMPG